MAARSKAWVYGRPIVEIVSSNPTGGVDVCLMLVLCCPVERSLQRADRSSRGVLSSAARPMSVIAKPLKGEVKDRNRIDETQKKK